MKRWLLFVSLLLAVGLSNAQQAKYTVYVFLGENCPICQYHTLTLNNLHNEFAAKGVGFIGVFPNPESDSATIDSFKQAYNIAFALQKDNNRMLMKVFGATITPQVFVMDVTGQILYKGRIDDKYVTLGKRKTTPVIPDLKNALDALLAGKPVPVAETKAVGCFIDNEY